MADIFVSYARADKARVAPLVAALEGQGWSVWWDPAITPGQEFDSLIRQELGAARAVIVVWTPASVDSRWVRGEARLGAERGVLVPVRFDKAELPIDALSLHTTDLDAWNGNAEAAPFRDLCRAVRALTARGQTDRPAELPSVLSIAASKPTASMSKRVRPIHLAIAASILAVMGGVGWFLIAGHNVSRGQAPPSAVSASAADDTVSAKTPAGISLAVLPFVNMSDDKEQEYFSDGLSEELLNQLAQIKNLRVAGRTSSFAFKGKNEDLRVIAQALGVNHLLEGSVRKAGDRLRITAQLINGADGSHLWSQSYDRELKDVFQVQEDIAKDVAQAMRVTLGVGEAARPEGGTSNVEAYDTYLRAKSLAYQLGPEQLKKSIDLFHEAVALDPNFALAWVELYNALEQSLGYIPENSAAAITEMQTAAAHITALDSEAWWAKSMLAGQYAHAGQWAEAAAAAKDAVEAAPSSEAGPAMRYAFILQALRRTNDSLSYFRKAGRADPLSLLVSGYTQLALESSGHETEAAAEYKRSNDLAGDHARWDWFQVVRLWSAKGPDTKAVDAAFDVMLRHESLPMTINHILQGRLNDKAFALSEIRKAERDPANQDFSRQYQIAFYADHYGDKDTMLVALRRGLINNLENAGVLWWRWETPGVRSDPRFKQLVRDLKIYDYWRASGNWGDYCHPVGVDDFECR